MSAPKHTPGPWRSAGSARKDSNFGGFATLVHGPEVARVAKAYGGNTDDRAICEANAKLIAAAPDLADALEALLPVAVEWGSRNAKHPALDAARAALRKAGRAP